MTRCLIIKLKNGMLVKKVKSKLESDGNLNKSMKIKKHGTTFYIYTTIDASMNFEDPSIGSEDIELEEYTIENSNKGTIEAITSQFLEKENISLNSNTKEEILLTLPKKWSVYPPMVLINTGTFDSKVWKNAFVTSINKYKYFEYILSSCLFPSNITHIAINRPIIEEDVMRRPFNIVPIFGEFGPVPDHETYSNPKSSDFEEAFWCSATQNGIFQTWAPRYTMFSRGNIKEKKRILDTFENVDNKVVFDLYAGIGYFTLSYLKNGATIFCWELNPWSIEGLIRGVQKAKYEYTVIRKDEAFEAEQYNNCLNKGVRVFIFHESNECALKRISKLNTLLPITHINLGLLPSSKGAWSISKDLISKYSNEPTTNVHIHENIHIDEFEKMKLLALEKFKNSHCLGVEKVKTFAPDIWHVVIDLVVSKKN